jgi:hypothetical protein
MLSSDHNGNIQISSSRDHVGQSLPEIKYWRGYFLWEIYPRKMHFWHWIHDCVRAPVAHEVVPKASSYIRVKVQL